MFTLEGYRIFSDAALGVAVIACPIPVLNVVVAETFTVVVCLLPWLKAVASVSA
jgi:hypothetical protein